MHLVLSLNEKYWQFCWHAMYVCCQFWKKKLKKTKHTHVQTQTFAGADISWHFTDSQNKDDILYKLELMYRAYTGYGLTHMSLVCFIFHNIYILILEKKISKNTHTHTHTHKKWNKQKTEAGVTHAIELFQQETQNSTNDRLMILVTDGVPVPKSQNPCNLTTILIRECMCLY